MVVAVEVAFVGVEVAWKVTGRTEKDRDFCVPTRLWRSPPVSYDDTDQK